MSQYRTKEALSGFPISSASHKNIDDVSILIDGSPQITALTLDGDEEFIDVPDVAEPLLPPPQISSIVRTEFSTPVSDCFVGDQDSALRELDIRHVEYVLVGGVALNLHGIIRATEDIDLFIQPEGANVERLKDALRAIWSDPSIDDIEVTDFLGESPIIRYGPPHEDFVIDLMSKLGTEINYDDLAAEVMELEGVRIRLGTPTTLYNMKKSTVRPIDKADAMALKEKFNRSED